jgi:hypothetical protein
MGTKNQRSLIKSFFLLFFFSFTLHRTGVIELLLVQKKLVEVIQARASNIGNGNLYVATLLNPIPLVEVTKLF